MTAAGIVQMLLRKIAEGGYEEVDIRFTDVLGCWRHVTLPAKSIKPDLFTRGVGFDGSTLSAMTPIEAGDLALVPDPRRVFDDPFTGHPTLGLIADILHPDTGRPYSRDPRGVARKAQDLLRDSGLATESFWAPEFEFYLLDKAEFWNDPCRSGFELGSIESHRNASSPESLGLFHQTGSAYHRMFPVDSLHDVRAEIASLMTAAGIQVKYHHHEVGRMGQVEVEVNFSPFLSSADNVMITKHIICNVALKHNLAATFMPKPIKGEPGNGMHFHLFLLNGEERVFYSEDGYCRLSDTARSAIAGILHHARALCAFTNPSINSYHRLVPNMEAPVYRFFSGANRSAAIRVPAYARTAESMRFEYRVPDGSGNPYLSMASILMAVIDGIRKDMKPEEMGFGPIDDNVFAPGYDTSGLPVLPTSLDEALDSLEEDREFLERDGVFEPDFIDAYVEVKRGETSMLRGNPHPIEHFLYFNI